LAWIVQISLCLSVALPPARTHLLILLRIPKQSHLQRSINLSSQMGVAEQQCRSTPPLLSIDTTPLVDRYPRDSVIEDSTNSLQLTPIADLCDKFSSIPFPISPSIHSLDSSKSASLVNKPRVPRQLVSSVILAGNKESVNRHNHLCRSTPTAAQTKSIYTPPWKARMQQKSSSTPSTPRYPPSQTIDSNKRLVGGNPLV